MKTKSFTLSLLVCIMISSTTFAVPGWQWARTETGTSDDRAYASATDQHGNVYVVGNYKTNAMMFGTTVLSAGSMEDIYIVKYDIGGNVLWAKSFGGTNSDFGTGVACDNSGHVFLTGYFDSPNITFGSITITSAGMNDAFVCRLDSAGNVDWANAYGGFGDDYGSGASIDANGNLIVIGNFISPAFVIGSDTMTAVGTSKAFVAKMNISGTPIWARATGGFGFDAAKCVTTDNAGNVYFAGEFFDYTNIIGNDTIMNHGYDDIFIVKYDVNGNVQWVSSAGNNNPDKVTGIVAENNGEVYISGHYFSPFIQFGNTTLNNAHVGAWDMYFAKLDVNGNFLWAKSASGNQGEDEITSMKMNPAGNLIVTGWYGDSMTLGNTNFTSSGSIDIFVAEMDTSGNFVWALSAGGSGQDFTNSMSIDINGDIYVSGFFESPSFAFGVNTIGDMNPGWDSFVAKLSTSTGIPVLENNKVAVYPNPAHGYLNVNVPDNSSYSIEIYNSTGAKILEIKNGNNRTVDCTQFAKGIYNMQIKTPSEAFSRAFIIE